MSAGIEKKLTEQGISFQTNASVHTPLLKAAAELVVIPTNAEQVASALAILKASGRKHYILGGGTKSLVLGTDDHPSKTAIIKTKHLNGIKIDEKTGAIEVGAGASVCTTSRLSAAQALTGLEFATDIPGTIAGAVATDAWHPIGSYEDLFDLRGLTSNMFNFHFKDILRTALVVDSTGHEKTLTAEELQMRDRKSILLEEGNEWFLLNAVFQLATGNLEVINRAREVISAGRKRMREKNKAKNPFSTKSTLGYTFVLKHPLYGQKTASQLIAETESLPEKIVIDGMVHSQGTPNIIANMGSGTADGYRRIADSIKAAVFAAHNIEMPLEIKVVE